MDSSSDPMDSSMNQHLAIKPKALSLHDTNNPTLTLDSLSDLAKAFREFSNDTDSLSNLVGQFNA